MKMYCVLNKPEYHVNASNSLHQVRRLLQKLKKLSSFVMIRVEGRRSTYALSFFSLIIFAFSFFQFSSIGSSSRLVVLSFLIDFESVPPFCFTTCTESEASALTVSASSFSMRFAPL